MYRDINITSAKADLKEIFSLLQKVLVESDYWHDEGADADLHPMYALGLIQAESKEMLNKLVDFQKTYLE